jgi:hypothetical protein
LDAASRQNAKRIQPREKSSEDRWRDTRPCLSPAAGGDIENGLGAVKLAKDPVFGLLEHEISRGIYVSYDVSSRPIFDLLGDVDAVSYPRWVDAIRSVLFVCYEHTPSGLKEKWRGGKNRG